MVDLSKIDFAKLDLELGSLKLNVRLFGESCVQIYNETSVRLAFKGDFRTSAWVYNMVTVWDDLLKLKAITDQVDAFIAAETARIEADEEAARWIAVPWQDVRFLTDTGAIVQWKSQREWSVKYDWIPCKSGRDGHPDTPEYRADKRTLPSGYDPGKPRWVEIERSDVVRLERVGCAIRLRSTIDEDNDGWGPRLIIGAVASNHCDYQVDIHTIPSGVPLHEEPKPAPRPCSREFALKHPKDSECRYTGKWYDSGWDKIDTFDFTGAENDYAFRTTASEEPAAKPKSRIIASVPVTNIDMSKSGSGSQIFLRLKTDSPATYNQCVEFACKPSEWTTLVNSERRLRLALIVDEES